MKSILIFVFLIVLLVTGCANSDLPPEPGAPGVTGNYYRILENDWATKPRLLTLDFDTAPTNASVTLTGSIQDDLIYQTVYYWNEGAGKWESFTLNEENSSESWLTNKISFIRVFPFSDFESIIDTNGEFFFVTYTCGKESSSWDCYDDKWQLAIVNETLEMN